MVTNNCGNILSGRGDAIVGIVTETSRRGDISF